MGNSIQDTLFEGLTALAESSFPKKCNCCGRLFETVEDFVKDTVDIPTAKSSLKTAEEEDGSIVLELFRNCPCGSTLMDAFSDRRDFSERGFKRREKFEFMLDFLAEQGIDKLVAREELLKVMHGQKSIILSCIHPPKKCP